MLKKIFNKEILFYLIRLSIFLILLKIYISFDTETVIGILGALLIVFAIFIITITQLIIRIECNEEIMEEIMFTLPVILAIICVYIIVLYLFSKITGIFKKIDNLKWYFKLSILILIYSLICIIYPFDFGLNLKPYKSTMPNFIVVFFIFPTYFLYMFFGFLSKKFTLFQKIGYYTSIDFYKNLYTKFFKKQNVKNI